MKDDAIRDALLEICRLFDLIAIGKVDKIGWQTVENLRHMINYNLTIVEQRESQDNENWDFNA